MKLHWYETCNFGDALSPALIERLSGQRVTCAHPKSADLIATGSVLFAGGALFLDRHRVLSAEGLVKLGRKAMDRFRPTLHIWGSGFLFDPGTTDVIPIRKTRVCAVRGKLTLGILRRTGIVTNESVALGDPGLLYADLLNELPPKEFDLGIVPHFRDAQAGRTLADRYQKLGVKVKVIDVMQPDPLNTVREIAMCEKMLSSSLHGLIVADSFGIPNRHIVFSALGQSMEEYLFKFNDYYSALGLEDTPLDNMSIHNLSVVLEDIPVREPAFAEKVAQLKRCLREAFPFAKK